MLKGLESKDKELMFDVEEEGGNILGCLKMGSDSIDAKMKMENSLNEIRGRFLQWLGMFTSLCALISVLPVLRP